MDLMTNALWFLLLPLVGMMAAPPMSYSQRQRFRLRSSRDPSPYRTNYQDLRGLRQLQLPPWVSSSNNRLPVLPDDNLPQYMDKYRQPPKYPHSNNYLHYLNNQRVPTLSSVNSPNYMNPTYRPITNHMSGLKDSNFLSNHHNPVYVDLEGNQKAGPLDVIAGALGVKIPYVEINIRDTIDALMGRPPPKQGWNVQDSKQAVYIVPENVVSELMYHLWNYFRYLQQSASNVPSHYQVHVHVYDHMMMAEQQMQENIKEVPLDELTPSVYEDYQPKPTYVVNYQ